MKFLLIFIFLILTACSPGSEQNELSYPFTAQVLSMNDLKMEHSPAEPPTFTFAPEKFYFLTNLNYLNGKYFKLYRGGEISQKDDNVEFRTRENPRLNYKIVNNVVVGKDYTTIAMISAYYQFDWISAKIEQISGISMDNILSSYGKIEIFFEPKFSAENGGIFNETYQKENAAYFPGLHKFILFSRSKEEKVPLSMNLQVISHEFGHSLWDYLFNKGKTFSCDRLNVEYSIMGLNEGFADFLSYTITGSTNILQNSLKSKSVSRMRNFSITHFNFLQIADIANENNEICNQRQYCIGTLFANALFKTQKALGYNTSLLIGKNSRSEFFKIIVTALHNTKDNISNLPLLPPTFDVCQPDNETSSFYNGAILGAFFQSFLNQIEDISVKKELHCALVKNFGERGFPNSYRLGACL